MNAATTLGAGRCNTQDPYEITRNKRRIACDCQYLRLPVSVCPFQRGQDARERPCIAVAILEDIAIEKIRPLLGCTHRQGDAGCLRHEASKDLIENCPLAERQERLETPSKPCTPPSGKDDGMDQQCRP